MRIFSGAANPARALMAVAGGSLALESQPGRYTRGILQMSMDQKVNRSQDR